MDYYSDWCNSLDFKLALQLRAVAQSQVNEDYPISGHREIHVCTVFAGRDF